MKRKFFYLRDEAYRHLSLANAYRGAARSASLFGSNPYLITLFRSMMREHAILAVRSAKLEAAR